MDTSYRHGQRALAERIITDLYDALTAELELLINEQVFLDRERLKGGDFYNEALSTALCESVCMIVVFTPTYFDKKYTYCSREYKAMENLENERLRALGLPADKKQHGLIIPIVFRGATCLPDDIKSQRFYYNFENFSLCDRKMTKNPKYAGEIRKIASYIAERYRALANCPDDLCGCCEEFQLPEENEVMEWLTAVVGTATPFPGR